ncbi:DUF2142 domain-containing protein [Silicimonas sp. MF1-12-2]|uniref:DUF2142 domain-containing protein n=1 Tax=Silicimonas sp. MF1-12-2 TaxID=3384793 RepID=UPI0039B597DF
MIDRSRPLEVLQLRSVLFVFLIVFAALFLSLSKPPFQSPDENDHLERAYLLSKGQLLLESPEGSNSGGAIDTGLLQYVVSFFHLPTAPEAKITADHLAYTRTFQWSGERQFNVLPGTGFYFPAVYVPQAIGLLVGESLGLSVAISYKLAQLATLLVASLFLLAAFQRMPASVPTLVILSLPMSLFQTASTGIDFLSTAALLLALAIFSRAMQAEPADRPALSSLIGISVLVFLVAACRLHLSGLVLLIFFIGLRHSDLRAFFMGSVVTAAIGAWYAFSITTTVDLRNDQGAPPLEILLYYLESPGLFLDVLRETFSGDLPAYYLRSFLGILGWADTEFSDATYIILSLCLVAFVAIALARTCRFVPWQTMAVFVAVALISVFLVFLSLLVGWTPHPAMQIEGVQGRYFLAPALILLACLVPRPDLGRGIIWLETGLLLMFFLYSVYLVHDIIQVRYYSDVMCC